MEFHRNSGDFFSRVTLLFKPLSDFRLLITFASSLDPDHMVMQERKNWIQTDSSYGIPERIF